jgi:hypothetical protein
MKGKHMSSRSGREPPEIHLNAARATFRCTKDLADRAIAQLTDDQLQESLAPGTNCVAVIIKHIASNMRSRWTDFLETDGEKPWRNRESEFVDDIASRDQLNLLWQQGWSCLFESPRFSH